MFAVTLKEPFDVGPSVPSVAAIAGPEIAIARHAIDAVRVFMPRPFPLLQAREPPWVPK